MQPDLVQATPSSGASACALAAATWRACVVFAEAAKAEWAGKASAAAKARAYKATASARTARRYTFGISLLCFLKVERTPRFRRDAVLPLPQRWAGAVISPRRKLKSWSANSATDDGVEAAGQCIPAIPRCRMAIAGDRMASERGAGDLPAALTPRAIMLYGFFLRVQRSLMRRLRRGQLRRCGHGNCEAERKCCNEDLMPAHIAVTIPGAGCPGKVSHNVRVAVRSCRVNRGEILRKSSDRRSERRRRDRPRCEPSRSAAANRTNAAPALVPSPAGP